MEVDRILFRPREMPGGGHEHVVVFCGFETGARSQRAFMHDLPMVFGPFKDPTREPGAHPTATNPFFILVQRQVLAT